MKPIQKAITGNESFQDLTNPTEVLAQFYSAFNNQNFELMSQNWLQNEEIAMDNPLGGIKRGWDEIQSVYSRIFTGQAKVYVEFYDYTIVQFDGGFCAIGRERGYVQIGQNKLELKIRTSRVYKLVNKTYKQVHHHGSIESPELLKEYQELVEGVTKLLERVLNKDPKTTFVIIEEIPCDNWGINNMLVSDVREC